ncbi:beta-taxilin-like [Impatiens glandulifera]|uniref:beta-taxilin-like n=1 Tax=Impatiens glandulifera TaxID=253017 RepID=UPI001FB0EA48|nr:beta-taxilin-like [Impatiens glandulifera]XP_047322746.1 beta-taxilin-like [Impatiens glandulifera]
MENLAADHLPEVDSLPDGFVEGSLVEPLAPSTPLPERDKLLADYKEEEVAEVDDYKEEKLVEFDSGLDLAANGIHLCDTTCEKGEKDENLRTFPVPLCENDGFDKLVLSVGSEACTMVRDTMIPEDIANPVPGDGGKVTCNMLPQTLSGEILAPVDKDNGNAGGLREQVATEQNISSINAEISNKAEISEVKRKNSKRNLKSEKEFLQFSLKYQQVLAERDAVIAVRDKLESLCRELQRQNKMLMDECKKVSTEGQNLRLDLSNRFQDAVKEINIKLEEQKDECLSQLKENEMLKIKLKHLADQYTLSEQQYAQKLKQKSLELQIADLKTQQHEEKLRQEQSQMKIYAEQMSQLLETERNLRLQLTADGEKFQQFQDALVKSNEVFETFKKEIEKMTKSNKELKKENSFLKSKCEKSDFTLVQLVEERELQKKQLEKTRKQKEKLESLCRSLQAERKQLIVEPLPTQ